MFKFLRWVYAMGWAVFVRQGLLWLALGCALWPLAAEAQEAYCAEVRIVIEQKLSLERQAFDAHLVIRNALQDKIENVRLELTFADQDQKPVTATADPNAAGAVFFQRIDRKEGLSALDGSGSIAGGSVADVHWLIIPAQGAGGDTAHGRMYFIGANLSYTLNGKSTKVEVAPDYVVVRPQPLLALDYFLPTDVQGDDPMTPAVEPVEPFTLGVRVANVGAGASMRTSIETAQPKIVENHQGLLVDFRILGGYVGNELQGKSLLLDFGDIASRQARMGRWVMEASLAGRFVEFDASFTHADSLGGAVTSLIKQVRTHKLVRDVLVDLDGHDDIADFLAEEGGGYRVYDSAGGDAEVADVSAQARLTPASGSAQRLAFHAAKGLVHAKVADPFRGQKSIARVVRSDGKVLPPQNFWLSKSRQDDLSWSYFLHVFDADTTGQYVIEFAQGEKASLSGLAWRDSNGNGVREAGEPADGNLQVLLKGVDLAGRNVLQQGYTDPAGAFSFTGLMPGRYQLETVAEDGWVDGAWAAGTAGGVVQPGLIRDIALTAGTHASGYLIARRRPDATPGGESADLAVQAQAQRSQLRGGEQTSVTVTVRNASAHAAQAVLVQAKVPDGLALQSHAASLGQYADGAWALGSLPAGQSATLTLHVKAEAAADGKDRQIAWPISAGARTADPQISNNSALLGLVVLGKAGAASLEQTLMAQARVLMLVSCPQAAPAQQSACEEQAARMAASALAGQAHSLQTVSTLADWNAAQRSNEYNMLWLHGGAEKLDEQALAELRAAVRRGATVVADGLPGAGSGPWRINQLADVLGAGFDGASMGNDLSVQFPGQASAQRTTGALHGMKLHAARPGQVVATAFAGGQPVMVGSTWGHGQSWVMGFDLLASMQGQASAFWSAYAAQQVQALTPVTRIEPALAGDRLPVKMTVHSHASDGAAQNVKLRLPLPAGLAAQDAEPPPALSQPQQLQWNWRLLAGQSESAALRLALPQSSQTLQIKTQLLDEADKALDEAALRVAVLGLDEAAEITAQTLKALSAAQPTDLKLVGQARQAQSEGNWKAALQALAQLQARLEALPPGAGADTALLDVARWIGVAQRQPQAAQQERKLVVRSGSGQSALVSTAFAQPLQLQVQDAKGRPVAGVQVRFTAPASGASASFNGAASVNAVTDAQGLAAAPAPVASAVAGSYVITAQAQGAQPVEFMLTNEPQDAPAAFRLEAVDGLNQQAAVGAAYGKPLSVRVVDAQQRPRTGVAVTFALPGSGPSARFAGAGLDAQAQSGADGVATSPALTANHEPGSFEVRITADGAAQPLLAHMTNLPATALQPGKHFEGQTATGTGKVTATVSGGGDGCVFDPNRTRMAAPRGVLKPLEHFLLPHGLFDFELKGCTPGSEVTVTTTWPDLKGITGYMKYGKNPLSRNKAIWYPAQGVQISGNTVTFTIRDGGWGDDDLTVNGVIKDPGGPIVGAQITAVPALERGSLWLLGAMLGALAVLQHRRRAGRDLQ